jgi:N-acetyl-1-D-myo-inositol-2-amino-2-deoxy-alpha-D-glucopyranoside deacetylase
MASDTLRASLLAVFAHPDDEVFHAGVLAHLSDRGVRVTLACATAGEAGQCDPALGCVHDLGALRTEELRLSCRRLGIDPPVFLGFHDSGRGDRQRHEDPLALAHADMLQVESAIRRVIDRVKPHVILTFDPHGGYYHPDHVAIHRATSAAFFSSGAMGADAPQRLFYGAMLRDVFRTLADRTRGRGIVDGLDPDVFAILPEMVAVTFDARAYLDRKLSALASHRTQFRVSAEMLERHAPHAVQLVEALRPVLEREVFVMGGARTSATNWPLGDFFDGLKTAEFDETRPWGDGAASARSPVNVLTSSTAFATAESIRLRDRH